MSGQKLQSNFASTDDTAMKHAALNTSNTNARPGRKTPSDVTSYATLRTVVIAHRGKRAVAAVPSLFFSLFFFLFFRLSLENTQNLSSVGHSQNDEGEPGEIVSRRMENSRRAYSAADVTPSSCNTSYDRRTAETL